MKWEDGEARGGPLKWVKFCQGAWPRVWRNDLPGKCEDLSLDLQHPHTCQVGVVTCDPGTWESVTRNLPEPIHQALNSSKKPCLKVYCGERYLMSVWCTHTHMCPHICMQTYKNRERGEGATGCSAGPLHTSYISLARDRVQLPYHTLLQDRWKPCPSQKIKPQPGD